MKKLWKKAFIVTCLIAYLKKKHERNVIKEGYVGHKQFFCMQLWRFIIHSAPKYDSGMYGHMCFLSHTIK